MRGEAAAALGRAQALALSKGPCRAARARPDGAVYYPLQGTRKAAGPKGVLDLLDDMHTVSGPFEKSRGNTEKRLHTR